jgi:hypothetical protein
MAPGELGDRLRRLAGTRPPRKRPALPPIRLSPRRAGVVGAAVVAAAALIAGVAAAGAGSGSAPDKVTPRAAVPAPIVSSAGPVRSSAAPVSWPSGPAVLPAIPASFSWWDDPSGFYRVAVRFEWARDNDAGALRFTGPGGRPVLRISTWTPKPPDVIAGLIAEEQKERASLPNYRRLRIEQVAGGSDAVWEYTYTDSSGAPVRCLEQVTTLAGRTYVIEWHTPRDSWAAGLADLAIVLKSFGPLGPGPLTPAVR